MGEWWQDGVIYQVYPPLLRGPPTATAWGDLAGILSRLDHLADLGVDALWLSPIQPSPMADFGYDVADYCNVDPLFGTLADLDRLVAACHARGLRLVLDLVPNHSSDRHPWFLDSRGGRGSARRDWYLWRDPAPGRRAAEQLAEPLRRAGLDARPGRPGSTTCTRSCRSSRT